MSIRKLNFLAASRLDVLEDDPPEHMCQVPGCMRANAQPFPGNFRTLFICSRHRPLYRKHSEILRRVRDIKATS